MPAQAMGGMAGQRSAGLVRAGQDEDGHGVGDFEPAVPFWQLGKVVGAHQPDEILPGEAFFELAHGVGGEDGAEAAFNIGGDDCFPVGDFFGRGQAVGERGHALLGFQRVAGGDHQPELVEARMRDRLAGDVQVAFMRGVEGAAEDADAAAAAGKSWDQGRT